MALLSTLLAVALVRQPGIPDGASKVEVEVKPGLKLEVFTYKPASYKSGPLVMIFHGVLRNAEEYRDHSKAMADKLGVLIAAPLFDNQRFPTRKYQYGGIMNEKREPTPREEWTYSLVPRIVDYVRKEEGKSDLPYYLVGHSAGGQFLVRMSAFMQNGAAGIVAANPGSQLFPTRERPFGYGYGNLPESLSSDEVMKKYLAQPLTLYLGTEDNKPDDNFDSSEEAMKQGPGRYQRNKAAYEFARKLAQEKGWTFNWRVVEAPGVAHDHEKMFNHENFAKALYRDAK